MEQSSIFQDVVRTEDGYTYLLRNLMLRDNDFALGVLRLLLPPHLRQLPSQILQMSSQVNLSDDLGSNGRADLLIETKELLLLVEVKIDSYCPLTIYQELELTSTRGYMHYLSRQNDANKVMAIAFLVPRLWKYAEPVRTTLERLSGPISGNLCTWEQLRLFTRKDDQRTWVKEFDKLLERDFMSISFTSDDVEVLHDPPKSLSSIALKLSGIFRKSQKGIVSTLQASGVANLEVAFDNTDAREAGISVKINGRDLLWAGVWEVSPFPAVLAIKNGWKLGNSLKLALREFNFATSDEPNWQLYDITSVLLQNNDDPLTPLVSFICRLVLTINAEPT